MIKQKINYLIRSVFKFTQEKKCPFCGDNALVKIDSKFIFTSLLACDNCKLNHRHPKDDEKWLKEFYQKDYDIDTHIMTKLLTDAEIKKHKADNFSSLRSYDGYINALFKTKGDIKIIDYGCSWGYNVYKLNKSGYNAAGYELSVPRAEFGALKLEIPIHADIKTLPVETDIFFSSHVIEHLNNINELISLSKKHLTKDGVFMAFCPNGSSAYRNREPYIWHVNWGFVHPNHLSVEFAQFAFRENPFLILTGDWSFDVDQISNWDGLSQVTGPYLEGKELLIIAKPNKKIQHYGVH